MITITLETSCLHLEYPELHELKKLKDEGHVELWIEPETEWEKMQWENTVERKKTLRWMRSNLKWVYVYKDHQLNPSEFQKTLEKVVAIHSPKSKGQEKTKNPKKAINKLFDCQILTIHILLRRDFFVTRDFKGSINNCKKERFESEFGIQVRKLDQAFINELKGIIENKTK